MKLFLLKLLCLSTIFSSAFATNQVLEEITIGDGKFVFYGYPLNQYVSYKEFRETYPSSRNRYCSAAERGYKGRWNISGGELYLSELLKNPCNLGREKEEKYDLKKLFPDQTSQHFVKKAIWFSGEIVIPISEYQIVKTQENTEGYFYLERQVIVYKLDKGNVSERLIEYRKTKVKNLTSTKSTPTAGRAEDARPFAGRYVYFG
jgi:hypothetical protein